MGKPTVINFLLDESGSMQSQWTETIAGFNVYVDTLRGTDKEVDVTFSLITFGDSGQYNKVINNARIDRVPYLTSALYSPRYGTAIADNALKCIQEMDAYLKQCKDDPNVVIVIQTDGEEGGGYHTLDDLKQTIAQKTKAGWKFIFMGCGIDAYSLGKKMGVATALTSSYRGANTEKAFENLAQNTVKYVHSGSGGDLDYTSDQRKKQGDNYRG